MDRVLNGKGEASPELRARAFSNADLPVPSQALIGKVATSPTQVTDADFAAAKAAGFTGEVTRRIRLLAQAEFGRLAL